MKFRAFKIINLGIRHFALHGLYFILRSQSQCLSDNSLFSHTDNFATSKIVESSSSSQNANKSGKNV